MDIVTHGLAGLVVARAATGQAWGRYAAAALAGSLGPDLDLVANLWDPLAPLTVHRVATHSPLGGVPLALVAAGLIRSISGGGFWRLAGVAYLGVLGHIVLDLFTPFGTPLRWPFDSGRWTVGSLYMIDPILTGILGASLLPFRWWRRPGRQVARAGLLALLTYLLLSTAVMKGVEVRWARALERQGISAQRTAVVPTFPGPVRWIGVAEGASEIVRARFWAWRVEVAGASVFVKENPAPRVVEVEHHPAVQRFLAVARFPWRRTVMKGDGLTVEYHELAFEDHPFGGPMVLRLHVAPSGAVQTVEWGHRL